MSLQFKVRLDEELHHQIKEAADLNDNSLNGEIVKRLAESVESDSQHRAIDAQEAKEKAKLSRENVGEEIKKLCYFQIHRSIKLGCDSAYVDLNRFELSSYSDEAFNELINPIVDELKQKGFVIQDAAFSEEGFLIDFS